MGILPGEASLEQTEKTCNHFQTAFRNHLREISHRYPAGFSQSNFVEGNIVSNKTKFAVSPRGSRLWNRLLNQEQKRRGGGGGGFRILRSVRYYSRKCFGLSRQENS